MGYVQPGQIEQLERAHSKPWAVTQDAVDLFWRGDTLAENPLRLGAISASGVVDQKTGGVRGDGGKVPRVLGQLHQPLDHRRISPFTANHLDQLHQRHRVEEVVTRHSLGPLAGTGDAGD